MRRSSFFGTNTSIQVSLYLFFLFSILFEKTNHFCKEELKISVKEVFSAKLMPTFQRSAVAPGPISGQVLVCPIFRRL